MGMRSKMKRSSSGSVVASCMVICLALLLVGAAATARNRPNSSCKAQCSGQEDYKPCHTACLRGMRLGDLPNCHLRCHHAENYNACFEQCKKRQVARGGGVGLLAAPEEGRKQEEEEARAGRGTGLLAMPTERAG
ncbi:hypothetical protein ACQJBY_038897 [Aegilops geniculata]